MKLFRKKHSTPASAEEKAKNKELARDAVMFSAVNASSQSGNHVGSVRGVGASFDISNQQKIAVMNLLNQDRD